jgi:hypothetical protein
VPLPRAVPLLPQLLADLARFEKDEEVTRETGAVDYTFRVFFFEREGAEPHGISRDCLTPGLLDGWPRAGLYEVYVVDSNGTELTPEPFRGQHLVMGEGALARRGLEDYARDLLEEQRIVIARRGADTAQAEQQVRELRAEITKISAQLTSATVELEKEKYLREKAQASAGVAKEKQEAAERAMELLQEELDEWKPHLEIAAEEFFGHVKRFFGIPEGEPSEKVPESGRRATPPIEGPGRMAAPAEERPAAWGDPKAAAAAAQQAMNDMYDAVIFDLDMLKELVDRGVFPWPLVRDLIFFKTGQDMGGEIPSREKWAEWFAARDAAQREAG